MAGLDNVIQALLTRIGECLGYDADQIIIDHVAMVSDLDIYRSAKLLISRYGSDASVHAAMEADRLLAKGDMAGKRTWVRIMRAIEELERIEPRPGEAQH